MGGLYGAAAEYSRVARWGTHSFWHASVYRADMIAVPALNLSSSSGEAPFRRFATLMRSLVWTTTEFVRRLVRAVL